MGPIFEAVGELSPKAVANVAKHYDFLPDPRTQAWVNLAMIAGAIYGPRIWVISAKAKSPPPAAAAPAAGNVTPMAPPSGRLPDWHAMPIGRA